MKPTPIQIPGHRAGILPAAIAAVLTAAVPAGAQQNPVMQAGPAQPARPPAPAAAAGDAASPTAPDWNPVEMVLGGNVPDTFAKGTLNLNLRLRYEQVAEDHVKAITKDSYAPTLRTRAGYTTAPLFGFQGMVEGVNVTSLAPEHDYNAAGSNKQAARPVVADPPLTKMDQFWAGYSYTNWIQARVGRQALNLDNQRFIGDVGWRQNMQTLDAAGVGSEPIEHLNLYYAYVWRVNRVFGNVDNLPAANTDFDSNSHLFNVSYSGWEYGRLAAYAYLLDLDNAAGGASSSATYGGYFAGNAALCDRLSADYRAEFAWQTQYGGSTLDYGAAYYNLEGGLSLQPFALGAGYEDLGSGGNSGVGGGQASFRTPLATLHSFNGWADVFLTTPADGLRDFYAYAQVTLPAQIPLRFIYHKYDADYGNGDYGQEFDAVISRKFGRHWSALVKYAYYRGEDAVVFTAKSAQAANVDLQKIWAQVEFDF